MVLIGHDLKKAPAVVSESLRHIPEKECSAGLNIFHATQVSYSVYTYFLLS